MQKLKYSVIDKLVEQKATNMELRFLFDIGQYQNERGEVIGVYYRSVIKEIDCSAQTYYNVLKSLQKKNIIEVTNRTDIDCDIRILDNSFEDGDYSSGYVNLRKSVFRTTFFNELKVNEKLILLDLLKVLSSNGGRWKINRNRLHQRYCDMLGVTVPAVWGYISKFKHRAQQVISIIDKYCDYTFILQKGGKRNTINESDEMKVNESVAECIIRRNRIRAIKQEDIILLAKLMRQYTRLASEAGRSILQVMAESLSKYLDWINRYLLPKEKRNSTINYPLLHKFVRAGIGLEPALGT